MTGAKILIETLIEQGADTVFGYPGGFVLDIFDELYQDKDRIRQILTCHEQGAAHAADGWARATGKTGVVIATSGPGATNLVTGIANAYMDSVPMVAVTGNVPLGFLGRDSFQEVDITGVTMPVTKHNYIVKDIAELADTVREAFLIARSGRPGPVLVDIPKNIQQADFEFTPKPPAVKEHRPAREKQIKAAAELINKAQRPMIYYGGGVIISGASKELIEFAEKIDCPVASSMMGLGGFPASHPLFMGLIGMHGLAGVSKSVAQCDLLIVMGARFSDRVAGDRLGFAKQADIIHIDIDNAEINKNVECETFIMSDVKVALTQLINEVNAVKRPEWRKVTAELTARHPVKEGRPQRIIKALNRLCPTGQIIATDVGQHQMWTIQTYKFEKPRTLLSSGGLGTMGFGMGAAIGGAIASGKQVVLITGDGSFHMNMNEVVTAAVYKLPIVILVFNNNALGMVRQWQKLFYQRRFSSTTLDRPTDYVKLAEAFGAKGMRLENDDEIESVLKKALAHKSGPVIVDCRLSPDDNVVPMIPAGKSAEDIIMDMED